VGDAPLNKKSIKLGLSGEALFERLCATQRGMARCALNAVPEPRVLPIHESFRYADLARNIDGPGAAIEAAPFAAREPTF
jgi:hypothetical protein